MIFPSLSWKSSIYKQDGHIVNSFIVHVISLQAHCRSYFGLLIPDRLLASSRSLYNSAVVEELDKDEYPNFNDILVNGLNMVEGVVILNLET
jgi:hypothetical protein